MEQKKKNRLASILHIKQNTQGTSNEISFSVLDAYKQQAEDKKSVPSSFLSSSGESSLHIPSATPKIENVSRETPSLPYNPEAEIARRKRKRKIRQVVSGVLGTLLLVSVGVGVTWFLYQQYEQQTLVRIELKDTIKRIASTDTSILSLDELLKEEVNQEDLASMQTLHDKIPHIQEELEEALQEANGLINQFTTGRDREAAGQTANAASARIAMFEAGHTLLDATVSTYHQAEDLNKAWSYMLDANTNVSEASTLVAQSTAENVKEASDKINQALDKLNQASEIFATLAFELPVEEITPYTTYIEKRTEGLNHALASNEAILLQDRQTAEYHNQRYNDIENEVANLAQGLPVNPTDKLYKRFDDQTKDDFNKYYDARQDAGAADSFLREYLGEAK